jgi:putative Mn2+ efflux pump MntP
MGIDLLSMLIIALGDSADCFAVSIGGSISMKTTSPWQILRTALAFGIFQALMTVLGWLAGRTVVGFIADYDHWAAFGLLALIGGRMVWESFRSKDEHDSKSIDITRGFMLITMAVATSIDALAVGLSFGFLNVNIALASTIIGVVAFLATIVGFLLGRRAGKLAGKRAEIVGGIILIAIGIKILLEHTLLT